MRGRIGGRTQSRVALSAAVAVLLLLASPAVEAAPGSVSAPSFSQKSLLAGNPRPLPALRTPPGVKLTRRPPRADVGLERFAKPSGGPLPAEAFTGNWIELGPKPVTGNNLIDGTGRIYEQYGNVSGRVDALAIDPVTAGRVYAGTAGGGVWRSNDSGATWVPLTDNKESLIISSLAIDAGGQVIYAGTGDSDGTYLNGSGVLKSTDGGTSWSLTGASALFGLRVGGLAIDRTTSGATQRVLAATNAGLYVSSDAGANWTRNTQIDSVVTGFAGVTITGGLYQVVADPSTTGKFWAAVADDCASEYGQVLVSTDSGTTWAVSDSFPGLLNAASRVAIGVGPSGVVYAATADCTWKLYDLEKTTDGGQTWNVIPSTTPGLIDYMSSVAGGQGSYDNFITVDPSNAARAIFGGITVLATTNGGSTFTDIARSYNGGVVHPDQHAAAFFAPSSFYLGNDGGIWKTSNLGGTGTGADWTNLNSTLSLTQFYSGTALDLTHLLGASQDNANPGSFAGVSGNPALPAWQTYGGGDGAFTAIDPTPGSNTIYYSYVFGAVEKGTKTAPYTYDDAAPCDFKTTTPACNDPTDFIAPFVMDPSNPQHLLAATNRVWESTSGGLPAGPGGWHAISNPLTVNSMDMISSLVIGPANTGTILTTSLEGAVYQSLDSGHTWLNITGNLPAGTSWSYVRPWIADVTFNAANPAEVWVAIGRAGVGLGHVWHTVNAGAQAGTTWTDLSGGTGPGHLLNIPALSIAADPRDPNVVYLGTQSGALVCTTCGGANASGSWSLLGAGLPNAVIKYLSFTQATTHLMAWTHGRGAWALPLPPGPPVNVHAVASSGSATVSWYVPGNIGSGAVTGYRLTTYAGGVAQGSTVYNSAATTQTVTGLSEGTVYTFTVAAINAAGTGGDSAMSNPVRWFTPRIVLPAVANAAYGGYTTVTYIENTGATAAHVTIRYFDATGLPVGQGDDNNALPVGGTWTVRQDNGSSFAPNQAGSAVIASDQPIAAFVNEFAPGNGSDATSYTGIKIGGGTGSTLYAPAIARDAYGGYTTGIGLVNLGTAATDVTITYRDLNGTPVKTQTLAGVAAGAYRGVYSGDAGQPTDAKLPVNFAGTATLTSSSGAMLAAIVNEVGPGGQFSSYDAVAGGSLSLAAPVALNEAFGGFNTGIGVQNTTGTAGTVTLTYYDDAGNATVKSAPIPANGYLGVYQGGGALAPAPGAYTARVTSDVAIAAIVNEVAPAAPGGAQLSTAYNTFPSGASAAHLPLVENAGSDGWSSGLGIMNTGSTTTQVTVSYFDAATGSPVGTAQVNAALAPNAFWPVFQPTAGLAPGQRATALVTTATGGSVAVICNESNPISFMSYGAQ